MSAIKVRARNPKSEVLTMYVLHRINVKYPRHGSAEHIIARNPLLLRLPRGFDLGCQNAVEYHLPNCHSRRISNRISPEFDKILLSNWELKGMLLNSTEPYLSAPYLLLRKHNRLGSHHFKSITTTRSRILTTTTSDVCI